MKYKKIALIGMMGSGKTTIAKLLSEKLNFRYVDLDEIFEKENNIKIKDYFKDFGEENFRTKESGLLKKISTEENIVISTGGGIVLKDENQKILFDKDILTVYLKANSKTIFERIKNETSRPLLSVENPKNEIDKILNSRHDLYNRANIKVITDNKTIEETVEEIWKKLI